MELDAWLKRLAAGAERRPLRLDLHDAQIIIHGTYATSNGPEMIIYGL